MSEIRSCRWCHVSFEILDDDIVMYHRFDVPYPTLCPDCRAMRRFAFRNERVLFYRKCSLTSETILSIYRSDTSFPVYKNEKWFSDEWERPSRAYDPKQTLFHQMEELKRKVPRMALLVTTPTMINSDYTNCAGYLKNCYLVSNSDHNEDCYYGSFIRSCKSCLDGIVTVQSELCYSCADCYNCYNLQYSLNCHNCRDGFFLENCIGCCDCLLCCNLRRKSYCILNKQYTKAEYMQRISELYLGKYSVVQNMRGTFRELYKNSPHPAYYGYSNENSFGNYLTNTKNSYACFEAFDLEDCRYCIRVEKGKDCMDYAAWGNNAELFYECMSCGDDSYHLKFCVHCWMNCMNLTYCDMCLSCKNCFGCVGLYKKEYCILNKQYSKEDYLKISAVITDYMKKEGTYGEFFPLSFSSHPYNDSIAQDYYPSTKQNVECLEGCWAEDIATLAPAKEYAIPDDIHDVHDDILDHLVLCESCGKPFKLVVPELRFYRDHSIPIPHFCYNCRYKELMFQRLPRKLFKNKCAKTEKEIITPFAPDNGFIVYDREVFDREFS